MGPAEETRIDVHLEAMLDRPFHFIIVLWGEQFRDYFLKFCLPSLLAPGNIPSLKCLVPGKFLIATRPDDWEALRRAPIFAQLERLISPVYIEIPPCPPHRSGAEHMGEGHKIACDIAFRAKAYAMVLTPDCMLSDGTVARLQELARGGSKLVLAAAVRFGEEPFLAKLREIGAMPDESRRDPAAPLVISGRQMVLAAINGFHTETLRYEWDAPYFPPFPIEVPAAAWWRVPEEDGIILHSLSWAPLLVDFGAFRHHDLSTLDHWTLDGDYLFRNLGEAGSCHVVADSDEMFIASWGPMADRPADLGQRAIFGEFGKGAMLRSAFYGPVFDPLKRRNFFRTVRWHSRPLTPRWRDLEIRIDRILGAYVAPPGEESRRMRGPFRGLALAIVAKGELAARVPKFGRLWWGRNHRRLKLLLHGDAAALHWAWWSIRKLLAAIARRDFRAVKPVVPGV